MAIYQAVYLVLYTVNSSQRNAVFVRTPPVNTTRRLAIKIELNNGTQLDVNRTFEYHNNPTFADVKPRNHLVV